MSRYFRWFIIATVAVASVFAVWAKRNGRWQIVAAQDAVYQAKAQETSKAQADSGVILVSAKQINSEIHKVSEGDPGTFAVFLTTYNPKTGYADVVRRTKPYHAEVHKHLVDTWYVIEGEGTLVTGGSLSAATEIEPDEFRGPAIVGGEERHIAKGDFVRIPAGIPHWISKIEGTEIIYLIVKAP